MNLPMTKSISDAPYWWLPSLSSITPVRFGGRWVFHPEDIRHQLNIFAGNAFWAACFLEAGYLRSEHFIKVDAAGWDEFMRKRAEHVPFIFRPRTARFLVTEDGLKRILKWRQRLGPVSEPHFWGIVPMLKNQCGSWTVLVRNGQLRVRAVDLLGRLGQSNWDASRTLFGLIREQVLGADTLSFAPSRDCSPAGRDNWQGLFARSPSGRLESGKTVLLTLSEDEARFVARTSGSKDAGQVIEDLDCAMLRWQCNLLRDDLAQIRREMDALATRVHALAASVDALDDRSFHLPVV